MDKISKAPDHVVRAILIALCEDSRIEKKALAYLNKITSRVAITSAVRTVSASYIRTTPNSSLKRKAESTIQICARCKDPFYPEENNHKPCRYHPGTQIKLRGTD